MKRLFLVASLMVFVSSFQFQSAHAQRVELRVNAYEKVNWSATQYFKANFHTHTRVSDGGLRPHEAVDSYHEAGYKILSLTDHIPDPNNPENILAWPWTDFSGLTAAPSHDVSWQDRDPEDLGMLAVQGSEPSAGHHRGSYFTDLSDQGSDVYASFRAVTDLGGLAMLFHPGRYWNIDNTYSPDERYSPEWYEDLYERFDVLIGMEVYNQGNRHSDDRVLWDEVLMRLMPDRPVWGYSNDDMHSTNQLFRNYQYMLMDSLTEEELRKAMRKGQLFFSFESGGSGDALAPRVDSITVNKNGEFIEIYGSDYDSIEWISGISGEGSNRQSRVVSAGETFHWEGFYKPYVRAVLINSRGRTYTQPFGFSVRTLHVSENGSDGNDGLDWESAFATLDRAIDAALDGDMIWVAGGTYTPTTDQFGNTDPSDPRQRSFQLQKNLVIYGGFAGYESELEQRDFLTYESILSGALKDGNKAYHVIFNPEDDEGHYEIILDGFKITDGMADGSYPHNGGGGLSVASGKLLLQNVVFTDNEAEKGGAVHLASDGHMVMNNVHFSGNYAVKGGAVYSHIGTLQLTNSRFTDNHAELGGVMYNEDSQPVIRNSVIKNNTAGKGGFQYNENSSPNLVHLSISGNTAEDAGDLFYNTNASNPRVKNSILWGNGSSTTLVINESQSEIVFRYSIVQESGGSPDWNSALGTDGGGNLDADPFFWVMDDQPLMIYGVSPAANAANSSYTVDSTDIRGLPRPAASFNPETAPDMGAYEFQPAEDIFSMLPIFIHSGSGSDDNNGMSWDSPFETLEKALQSAGPNDTIWVAAGTYYPTREAGGSGERYRSFQMKNHVAIFGGFAGYEESLDQRDFLNNESIVSGQIGRREHVFNVFFHDETLQLDSTAVLDGFIITGGIAQGNQPRNSGGGMLNIGSSPTIRNTIFMENSADMGGGMFNDNASSPFLFGTAFIRNNAANGAGMYNREHSAPVVVNTSFIANDAGNEGGAVFNNQSSPLFVNVLMSGNAAFEGGAIANYLNSEPVLINSTLSGNLAFVRGGGIFNSWEAHPKVHNSIIWGNIAGGRENPGSQIANDARSFASLVHTLYGDDERDIFAGGGFFVDEGNLTSDPMFLKPVNALDAPVEGGNLRLHFESPAIDAGDNTVLPAFAYTDLNGRPRISDGNRDGIGIIDLGAFEYIPETDPVPSGNQDREDMLPREFRLLQNYPNPFNPVTVIGFHLPIESHVTVEIVDVLGRRVALLVDEQMPAGEHKTTFDASHISSGVYLYRIGAADFVQTRKMLLLK